MKKMEIDSIEYIKKLKSLCPLCEKILTNTTRAYRYVNKKLDKSFYFSICLSCEFDIRNSKPESILQKFKNIELNILSNECVYAIKKFNLEIKDMEINQILNYRNKNKKNIKINALIKTTGFWHAIDKDYFLSNPLKRFYARRVFEGEIEETNKNNAMLKKDAIDKGICFAIIHEVAPLQRVYIFTSDLSNCPYHDEAFIAAMFIVKMTDNLGSNDIEDMYEQIKKNKDIVKKYKL